MVALIATGGITIDRIVNVTKGSKISFDCTYDNTTPPGNQSVFNINGIKTTMPKVRNFFAPFGGFLFLVKSWLFICVCNKNVSFSQCMYTN